MNRTFMEYNFKFGNKSLNTPSKKKKKSLNTSTRGNTHN